MSDTPISVRFMEQADLDEVVACEVQSHSFIDPDFGVLQMPTYAWGMNDLLSAVRQYKSASKGWNDTRALVAEMMEEHEDESGLKAEMTWVCGAMVYEIQQDGYELLLLTAEADASGRIRATLLDKLLGKAHASETRKRLSMMVPDGDYQTLAFLQKQGWSHKLVSNKWDNDHWQCEFRLPSEEHVHC